MAAIFLALALASSVPTIDIESACRGARSAALPEDRAAAYDSCMRDEKDALAQLRQKWTQYSAEAHAACVEDGGFALSYVELRTCLEMQPGGSLSIQNAPPSARRPPP